MRIFVEAIRRVYVVVYVKCWGGERGREDGLRERAAWTRRFI